MPRKVGCYIMNTEVVDDDSVAVTLDFDGLDDPENAAEWVRKRKELGTKVTIWDVIAVVLFMNAANRKKEPG